MCCSDGDYDPDMFMFVLRCTCVTSMKNKNKKFLVRCIVGFLLDCVECITLESRKRNETLSILVAIAAYFILIVCTVCRYWKGKDVYKFNYILSFKLLSSLVAVLIFYVTSDFDRETIKQLYDHFMEGVYQEMFLTVVNTVSLCYMLFNVISWIFLFLKFCIAKKKGKDTCFKSVVLGGLIFSVNQISRTGRLKYQPNKTYSQSILNNWYASKTTARKNLDLTAKHIIISIHSVLF